jgi:hypothetical protein
VYDSIYELELKIEEDFEGNVRQIEAIAKNLQQVKEFKRKG